MHNRKKSDAPRSSAELEGIRKKKLAYSAVANKLLDMKVNGVLTADALAFSDGLLKQNPDYYSIWNYRRTILLSMYGDGGEVAPIGLSSSAPGSKEGRLDSAQAHALRDTELALSAAAIKKNPKSYGAWYHRQWILDRINIDVNVELELCKEFLLADQRNFHCWNYRRYLVGAFEVKPRSEFEFASSKIEENFSNYSAFHHRSVFIDAELTARPVEEVLSDEISIVENAIYTDPYDQSAFWYLQFLLRWSHSKVQLGSFEVSSLLSFLEKIVHALSELLEVEPNSKWTMVALFEALKWRSSMPASSESEKSSLHTQDRARCSELLSKLCEVDVAHANRYKYLKAEMKM